MLEEKLKDNTVIEAGHYSYLKGPTELDLYLWEFGIQLYSYAKGKYANTGLMLLVDDMQSVVSNEQRKSFRIGDLPESFLTVLEEYKVNPSDVIVISQYRMSEKGKQLLRAQGKSRSFLGNCERIVASMVRNKQTRHFSNSIGFYDESKTAGGIDITEGTRKSREIFNTTMECHYLIFRDKKNYRYFYI